MVDPIQLYRELTPLRHIRRFSQHACVAPISVAEHSFYVGILASSFAGEINRTGVVAADRYKAMEAGLWHDAGEAVMGDVPHPVKKQWKGIGEAWDKAELDVIGHLARLYGGTPTVKEASLEGLLVKLADCVELLLYVYEERQAGNGELWRAEERIRAILDSRLRGPFHAQHSLVARWYDSLSDRLNMALHETRTARMIHGTYAD